MTASTAKPVRTGAWLAAQRRKLSAIQHPHKADPADFSFDAASAQAKLAMTGDFPPVLTADTERARHSYLSSWMGVSWKTATGRIFTDEFWNPLIGLWVARNGWDFVFDLVMPDPARPAFTDLRDGDSAAAWYAIRRYLWRASEADYARARARIAPVFAAARASTDHDVLKGRDYLAYAFDRDSDWAEQIFADVVAGTARFIEPAMLLAVCKDAALSLQVLAQGKRLLFPYFVFDVVETLGSASIPVLQQIEGRGAPDRKRVESAIAVAEKLKALGL